MLIEIDFNSDEAIYVQIQNQIIMGIAMDTIREGDPLPSVRQMAMELSINPNTIQRAYMTMEQEGLIYPVKGKGNFVADISSIRQKSKEDFYREFRQIISKGMKLGIEKNELLDLVQKEFEEGNR